MLTQLRSLSLFADVARCRHVATGAELHGMSQGAASQRIKQLEQELGVSLFDRGHRPLQLTSAGQVFLDGCHDLLQRAEYLEHAVHAAAQVVAGELEVAAIYSAGIETLESARKVLEAELPSCQVTVRYRSPDEVERLVLNGDCELGIVSFPHRVRRVAHYPLCDEPLVFACPTNHPLADGGPLHVSDLNGQALLMLDSALPLAREISQYLRGHGSIVSIGDTFDNIDTLLHALNSSRRGAILPEPTVAAAVASGHLRTRPIEPGLSRPIGIIAAKAATISPLAERFIAEVQRLLPNQRGEAL